MSWEVKPLGELSKIMYGYTESASIEKVGPHFLRITDIQEYGVEWSTVPYCKIAADVLKKYRLAKGDIVFARTGATTGKSFLVTDPPESVFASYLIRVQINNPSVLPEYLNLYFQTPQYWEKISEGTTGSAQGGFNATKLGELNVPLPPLPEQQRIVGKLDAAFAALREAEGHVERNRANARELFESYLNGVFEGKGWPEARLGDECKTASGGTPLRSRKDFFEGGTIPWLMSGEVAQGEVNSATNFITQMAVENSSAKLFPPDTVLVAMYGATAGQVGILRFEATTNQAVCGIYPNAKFLPEFLFYVFLHKKAELVAQATGGAQPNISQAKIRDTRVPMPILEQQRRLVKQLSSLKVQTIELEATYQQKLIELDGLKKGLLGAAFRGEL